MTRHMLTLPEINDLSCHFLQIGCKVKCVKIRFSEIENASHKEPTP